MFSQMDVSGVLEKDTMLNWTPRITRVRVDVNGVLEKDAMLNWTPRITRVRVGVSGCWRKMEAAKLRLLKLIASADPVELSPNITMPNVRKNLGHYIKCRIIQLIVLTKNSRQGSEMHQTRKFLPPPPHPPPPLKKKLSLH